MQASDEIKAKLDIVDLIKEYLPSLKPAGVNFKTNCPFHQEKNPSFVVSPDKQIWHCFGCGEGGDIFSFVMKIEGIDFRETLKILAPKAGVVLKQVNSQAFSQRNRLLEIMEASANYYHELLCDHPEAKEARDYLQKRGLNSNTLEEWLIGYSLNSWDDLILFLKKKSFSDQEIFLAGLSVKKEGTGRYYNRFRGRIMFPIFDHNNSVIAFSARVSPSREAEEKMGKYINSPATELYNKSAVLFGFNRAKIPVRNHDLAVVMEGQMDVITAHQHGFKNTVASSGTALNKEQLILLKRYSNNLALAFDMDEAGQMAAERAIKEALSMEMTIKVIILPAGKDPDECIKEDPQVWEGALKNAQAMFDYYLHRIFSTLDINKIEDKRLGAAKALNIIAGVKNKIEKNHYLKKLSEFLGVEEYLLREALPETKTREENHPPLPVQKTSKAPTKIRERINLLSGSFLAIILKFPSFFNLCLRHEVSLEYLAGEDNKLFYKNLLLYYNKGNFDWTRIDSLEFYQNLKNWLINNENISDLEKNNQLALLNELVILGDKDYFEFEQSGIEGELLRIIIEIKDQFLKQKMKSLEKMISETEKDGDEDKLSALLYELNSLRQERNNLRS